MAEPGKPNTTQTGDTTSSNMPAPSSAPASGSAAPAKDLSKEADLKIILLGDSAVGKSKIIERFLMDHYQPFVLSTYALTRFRYDTKIDNRDVTVDFWDTAGRLRPFYRLSSCQTNEILCAALFFIERHALCCYFQVRNGLQACTRPTISRRTLVCW